MRFHGVAFVVVTALGMLVTACKEPHPCDEGTVFVDGLCKAAPVDAAAGPVQTVDAANASDAGPTFGTACMDGVHYSDCQGAVVDVCLIVPGQTVGYCSYVGCDTNPICPPGWTCFDLSTIQAGAPWGCVKF